MPMMYEPSFTAKAGAGGLHGRCTALRSRFMNEAFVSGTWFEALYGPAMRELIARSTIATMSSRWIQLMYWRPLPTVPPSPERREAREHRERTALASEHDAESQHNAARRRRERGAECRLPLLAHLGHEVVCRAEHSRRRAHRRRCRRCRRRSPAPTREAGVALALIASAIARTDSTRDEMISR